MNGDTLIGLRDDASDPGLGFEPRCDWPDERPAGSAVFRRARPRARGRFEPFISITPSPALVALRTGVFGDCSGRCFLLESPLVRIQFARL